MAAPSWSITSCTTNHPGDHLVPSENLTVNWAISGQAGNDCNCYVAVRSFDTPDVIVADLYPHPKCTSMSAVLFIPPMNTHVPTIMCHGTWHGSTGLLVMVTPIAIHSSKYLYHLFVLVDCLSASYLHQCIIVLQMNNEQHCFIDL